MMLAPQILRRKSKLEICAENSIDNFQVIKILSNDVAFRNLWRLFCNALDFDSSTIQDLEQKGKSEGFHSLIYCILELWKSKSSKIVTREALSEKLTQIGCNKSAEEVRTISPCGRKSKSNKIWFNVQSPTLFYIGRGEEIQKIENQWKKCKEMKTMLFVAVTGLGGIGKSELARYYARQFCQIEEGHCIWIDGETPQTLRQNVQNLAKNLEIPLRKESGQEKSLDALVEEIYKKLSNEKCLLIIDNMETYKHDIFKLLTELASKDPHDALRPFVLITSRSKCAKTFFGEKCIQIELDVLSNASAMKFFSQSFCLTEDLSPDISPLVKKLCERLGNFPLAMQQASAYINENHPLNCLGDVSLENKISTYLDDIDKAAKVKLLNHNLPKYGSAVESQTTYLTWVVTLDKIRKMKKNGQIADKLLQIISFFSPNDISTEFLSIFKKYININDESVLQLLLSIIINGLCRNSKNSNHENGGEENFLEGLEILHNHSMINLSGKISIHPLVQEVTRIQLKEKKQFSICLENLLISIKESINDISWDQMTHVMSVWEHTTEITELTKTHGKFPSLICWKLHMLGKYREAYKFSCDAAIKLDSILGNDDRLALKLHYWKGKTLEEMGEFQKSLELLTDVYQKQNHIFGENDEHCLQTAGRIGVVHCRLKNYDEAKKWLDDTLKKMEQNLGKKYEILNLKHNIASVYYGQGKLKEAGELWEEVLCVWGMDLKETLITKLNLACVEYRQNNYKSALKMFQEILQKQEELVGIDHPDSLITRCWIATTHASLGMNEEALQLAIAVHATKVVIHGPEHPDTLYAKYLIENLQAQNTSLDINNNIVNFLESKTYKQN